MKTDLPIIPDHVLTQVDSRVLDRIRTEMSERTAICDDPLYGLALRRYLLFSYFVDTLIPIGITITAQQIFYNRYYWFYLFVKLARMKHGVDDANEQQIFQLMEHAPEGTNWDIVEQITNEIDNKNQP